MDDIVSYEMMKKTHQTFKVDTETTKLKRNESKDLLAQLSTTLLNLFRSQPINIRSSSSKHLLPNTITPHKLFRYSHGITIQQFRQEGPKSRTIRQWQQPRLEFHNETIGVCFFFACPFSSS